VAAHADEPFIVAVANQRNIKSDEEIIELEKAVERYGRYALGRDALRTGRYDGSTGNGQGT